MPCRANGAAGADETARCSRRRCRLMQDGFVPSVSDVAEAAEVSRATAYRYFPSQAAHDPGGGRRGARADPATGARDPTGCRGAHRGAARLRLSAHASLRGDASGGASAGARPVDAAAGRHARRRGARSCAATARRCSREALDAAARHGSTAQTFDRLTQSLSLIFGTEAIRRPQGHLGSRRRRRSRGSRSGPPTRWSRAAVAEAAPARPATPPVMTRQNAAPSRAK